MLILSSTGRAWERAFQGALEFLEREPDGKLLLGPKIGTAGESWITKSLLDKNAQVFGKRILPWQDWLKDLARETSFELGESFVQLNAAAERDLFRETIQFCVERQYFKHIHKLLHDEEFFSALLDTAKEARKAGLIELEVIERAREILQTGSSSNDEVYREVYNDLWNLLQIYNAKLLEKARFDEASTVAKAASGLLHEKALYLLGFEHFSALEIDLIQRAARNFPVHVPLPLRHEELKKSAQDDPETLAAAALQGLLTGFSGEVQIANETDEAPEKTPFLLLHAHTPEAEARAAAEYCRWKKGRLSLVAAPQEFVKVEPAFLHTLGIEHSLVHKAAVDHSVVRLVLHVFQLKEEKYPLALGIEIAELFAALTGEFANVPEVALRAGVRKGIGDWRRDRELEPFADRLFAIGQKIPDRGRAGAFKGALDHVLEELHFAKLARSDTAPSDREERETHVALAALIRNAQMLASATTTEFTLAEWISEITALLKGSALDTECELEGLRFHGLGEWVPPGAQPLVLGLSAGSEPRIHFNFYLEERVRRQLGEFRLRTQLQMEMQFVDYLERLHLAGALFSRSTHGSDGKELTQAWPLSGFAPQLMAWPAVDPHANTGPRNPEVRIAQGVRVDKFSASYFELYKECPFKAYVKKVLRLEDKAQDAKLDISYLDEGSLFHRALEIYYAGGGKNLRTAEERRASIVGAMDQAASEKKLEFYSGNETLLEIQVDRLKRILVSFVETDAEYYAQFPTLGVPKTEVAVQGELAPGVAYSGKIDRVDVDEQNKKLLVVDYKSGASLPGSKEIQNLERFQLPLYLEAAEKVFPDHAGVGGYYVSLKSGARNQGMVVAEHVTSGSKPPKPGEVKYIKLGGASSAKMPAEKFYELREQSKAEMVRLAGNVRAGDFSVTPIDDTVCGTCEVRPVCRIREIRAPAKTEPPRPDVAAVFTKIQKAKSAVPEAKSKREQRFNERQRDALSRREQMVFIEASAGTGKTTVIVEKIRSFLAERMATEASHKAVERFLAISFTEKSTQELSERLSKVLLDQYGAKVAAQAIAQVQTIHGFCRRVINDFPIEAGTSPLARMLGQWEIEALKSESLDELFLHPSEDGRAALSCLYDEYSRRKIAQVLVGLIDKRLLLREDLRVYRQVLSDLTATGPGVFPDDEPHKRVAAAFFTLLEEYGAIYRQKKNEQVALDFNDLEELALGALAVPAVRAYYQNRFQLVLVDEFQDTNSVQRGILDGLATAGGKNFFFVGDAKQSIYRFRNADVAVFTELRRKAAQEGALVTLTENYRSKNELVAVFNQISKAIFPDDANLMPFEAPHAEAEATQGEGGRCVVYKYKLEKATAAERREFEAKQVAKLVRERIDGGAKSVALLLRKVNGNEVFLKALNEAGIPYRIGSSGGFYEQQVVLDGIAFLRAVISGTSEIALLALLRSPWVNLRDDAIMTLFQEKKGSERFESVPFLVEWRKKSQHLTCSELLRRAFQIYPLGVNDIFQVEKLCQTVLSLETEGHSKFAILRLLSAWSGWEREDDALNEPTMPEPAAEHGVHVLTVHAAKGLEFDVTILADLDAKSPNDLSPLRILPGIGFGLKTENDEDAPAAYSEMGARNSERDLAESKRLFYVAVTRAKNELVLLLQDQERDKKETWADFVRAASLGALAEWKIFGTEEEPEPTPGSPATKSRQETAHVREFPHAISRGFSVSELAAFHFCPEFHRKKFVQRWDDLVIDLWPKEKIRKAPKKHDELGLVLKNLGVQRKERGIALHRVLERIKNAKEELGKAEEWLREAYEAQGVDMSHEKLPQLIEMDLVVLTKFLGSPFARAVFSPRIDAYPEIPFSWKSGSAVVHGTIDRMVIDKENASTVVLDYKSSLHDESRARYELQLHCYLLATEQFLKAKKIGGEISGFLVDLNTGEEHPVPFKSLEAWAVVEELVTAVMENYTLTGEKQCIARFQVKEKPECLTCAYSMHCEIGRKYM